MELLSMLLQLFTLLLMVSTVNSFIIVGVFIAANDKDGEGRGLILSKFNDFFVKTFGTYWAKPFTYCYKCMGSVWGGIPLILFMVLFGAFSGLSMPWWYWTLPLPVGALYAALLAAYSTLLYNVLTWFSKTPKTEVNNDNRNYQGATVLDNNTVNNTVSANSVLKIDVPCERTITAQVIPPIGG